MTFFSKLAIPNYISWVPYMVPSVPVSCHKKLPWTLCHNWSHSVKN